MPQIFNKHVHVLKIQNEAHIVAQQVKPPWGHSHPISLSISQIISGANSVFEGYNLFCLHIN